MPFGLLLAALTAIRLVVAAAVPLSPDEAYYWVWSRALAPGYLDHPPMVALWIRAGTLIEGPSAFGVRLLAPLAAAVGTGLLAAAAEDLVPARNAGLIAATLLNATLMFGVGAVTMTPDTPLLFFWTLALWALGRLLTTGDGRYWLAAGIATGCALESKYTGFLLLGGIGLWVLLVPSVRPWLRRWHSWAGLLLALALFVPDLAWNAAHHWASFAKQGGRTGVWHPVDAVRFLGELIGGQIGLATPIVFALLVGGVWLAARRSLRGDAAAALLVALTVPGAVVFLEHALGDRVQANWPSVLYPAAAIAAAGLRWRPWRSAAALGFAITALVYVQAAAAPFPLPPRLTAVLARLSGWPGLAAQIALAQQQAAAAFVATDEYGLASELARELPPDVPVIGVAPRWRYFDLPPATAIAGHTGLLIRSGRRTDAPDPAAWASIEAVGTITRLSGGVATETYKLYRVVGRANAADAVLLPRPQGGPSDAAANP
jgi:4-amino-4-deoxy-L-arabinose transferase-like glycosyltransferase